MVLEPYYSSLPLPAVLVRDLNGGNSLYNRCARRGFVRLFSLPGTEDTTAGGYLLMPYPVYHDPTTKALNGFKRKKITSDELQSLVAEQTNISQNDRAGKLLDFSSTGYI